MFSGDNVERLVKDWTGSKKNAEELAKRIRRYWFDRGQKNVDVVVLKEFPFGPDADPIWVIRSNIQLRGYPDV